MAKAIFTVLFKVIVAITNIFLRPINLLLVNFVPDLSNLISKFNSLVLNVGSKLAYFSSMLPPTTKTCITIYLGFLIVFYTASITAHGIIKVIEIIKAIKIW